MLDNMNDILYLRRQNNSVAFFRLVHIDDSAHSEGHFDKNAFVACGSLRIDCEMQTGP